MKSKYEKFPKKGGNPHDPAGRSGPVCPKCGAKVPPKPGFRDASLKCPQCGAAMGKS